jgi:hypothetical protein
MLIRCNKNKNSHAGSQAMHSARFIHGKEVQAAVLQQRVVVTEKFSPLSD